MFQEPINGDEYHRPWYLTPVPAPVMAALLALALVPVALFLTVALYRPLLFLLLAPGRFIALVVFPDSLIAVQPGVQPSVIIGSMLVWSVFVSSLLAVFRLTRAAVMAQAMALVVNAFSPSKRSPRGVA